MNPISKFDNNNHDKNSNFFANPKLNPLNSGFVNNNNKIKPTYTRVFKDCNEFKKPKLDNSKKSMSKLKYDQIIVPNNKKNVEDKKLTSETKIDPSLILRNKNYISIQDHQALNRNIDNEFITKSGELNNNNNSLVIPYVEVADYSDKGEESLDDEDGDKNKKFEIKAKHKSVSAYDGDIDNDAVDPGTPSAKQEKGPGGAGAVRVINYSDADGDSESISGDKNNGDIDRKKLNIRDEESEEGDDEFGIGDFDFDKITEPFDFDKFLRHFFSSDDKSQEDGEETQKNDKNFYQGNDKFFGSSENYSSEFYKDNSNDDTNNN